MALAAAGVLLAACQGEPVAETMRATEALWCADADGHVDTVTWAGHDGDLTAVDVRTVPLSRGEVTQDELFDACADWLRWLRRYTLCEVYAAPETLKGLAADEQVDAVHGQLSGQRPGFPVVVRGNVTCAEVTLEVDDAAARYRPTADRLRQWDADEEYSQLRDVERGFREAADGGCLDVDAARALAFEAADALPGDWPILESTRGAGDELHAGLCFDVRLDRDGVIRVGYHRIESPQGRGPVTSPEDETH